MLTAPAGEPLAWHLSAFDLASRKTILAAVSGGSDSTALLVLLQSHLAHLALHAPATDLIAVTIDHGLRAASADEARMVADLCARLGIAHRTLCWRGAKPATGLAAAARDARYHLLHQAARDAGTDIVLTGHTADDQAETVAMRKTRGDGRGLAGMSPATLMQRDVWLLRPLLGIARTELRDLLDRRGIGWIDDPSNDDRASERVRIRAALTPAGRAAMLATADAAKVARIDLGRRAADLIGLYARMEDAQTVRLDGGFAGDADSAGTVYALRLLLAAVGGVAHLPAEPQVSALIGRLATGENLRHALSRVLVEAGRAGIRLSPEKRGALSPDKPASPASLGGFAHLLPSFDMAPAQALARLLRQTEFPAPPLLGHD